MSLSKELISTWFKGLQDEICQGLEKLDGGARFEEEIWERPGGGGGRTRIIQGQHIEKGGVNFSAVEGHMPENISKALQLPATDFYATGVSIVLHPSNPNVPIIHMNVRYFETTTGQWWFGGGIDLTPHYIIDEDARFFHQALKNACDKHNPEYYPKYRNWADDYFYIKHRNETRGIGGIFFDRLHGDDKSSFFPFVQDVGLSFLPTYSQLFKKHFNEPFTPENKEWQLIRRGRYVEFNLVLDKGTKFGLDTDGRTESILMSLPKDARWMYNHTPAEGSQEAYTLASLVKGKDWLGLGN